ncbi:MAG: flagellar assembly peptidoglycan hydrolase FlgJ [Pseudomonadales bacterium]
MLDGNSFLGPATSLATDSANVFTDLNGLNAIKKQGRVNEEEALRTVARQFESMFVNMMLKSMRAANKVFSEGNYLQGFEGDMHQQNYDNQLSLSLTEGQGMGLADVMFQQMQQQYLRSENGPTELQQEFRVAQGAIPLATPAVPNQALVPGLATAQTESAHSVEGKIVASDEGESTIVSELSDIASTVFQTPAEFVQRLLPQLREAAESLGIEAKALVAQAALETGWGKKMIEGGNGQPSFNLFGIKASGGWQGSSVTVPTVEFESGVAQRKFDAFRSYDSFAESAMDYAQLIKNSPRYQAAMSATDNISSYWKELQSAGYATDPQYANKLDKILHSDTLKNALRLADTLD